MKITPLDDDEGKRTVAVECEWSELAADYDDAVTAHARTPVPGFRRGKAPRAVVERQFRREIVASISDRAVQRFGREAARTSGIEAMGALEIDAIECDPGSPFRFRLRYYPAPEIVLPNLEELRHDGDVDDAVDWISRRLLELVPFDVPEPLVRNELASDGLDEAAPGDDGWTAAADRLRLMAILKTIARREGIEIDDADVDDRIRETAKEYETTAEALRRELEQRGGMMRLRDMLLAESTIEYLRTGA